MRLGVSNRLAVSWKARSRTEAPGAPMACKNHRTPSTLALTISAPTGRGLSAPGRSALMSLLVGLGAYSDDVRGLSVLGGGKSAKCFAFC